MSKSLHNISYATLKVWREKRAFKCPVHYFLNNPNSYDTFFINLIKSSGISASILIVISVTGCLNESLDA